MKSRIPEPASQRPGGGGCDKRPKLERVLDRALRYHDVLLGRLGRELYSADVKTVEGQYGYKPAHARELESMSRTLVQVSKEFRGYDADEKLEAAKATAEEKREVHVQGLVRLPLEQRRMAILEVAESMSLEARREAIEGLEALVGPHLKEVV